MKTSPLGTPFLLLLKIPQLIQLTAQHVSTVRDLGLPLNAGLRTDDIIARATKKTRGMLFYPKQSFATQTPSIFLP